MEEVFYYGFELDKNLYLLAIQEGENRFVNFTAAKEDQLEEFVKLSDKDIKHLENILWFDLDTFPLTFRKYELSEV